MKVSITPQDKEDGVREDECLCPVARAISRELGKPVSVLAGGGVWQEERYLGVLPQIVKVAINAYDHGAEMIIDSFEFEMVKL